MTDELHARNRAALTPLRKALYDFDPEVVSRALQAVFHPQAVVHLATRPCGGGQLCPAAESL